MNRRIPKHEKGHAPLRLFELVQLRSQESESVPAILVLTAFLLTLCGSDENINRIS